MEGDAPPTSRNRDSVNFLSSNVVYPHGRVGAAVPRASDGEPFPAPLAESGRRRPVGSRPADWHDVEALRRARELCDRRQRCHAGRGRRGFAGEVDLLSVDVDGFDYWVWKAITVCSARVMMLEYNSMFGAEKAVTVPYDPKFNRRDHRFCCYGASLNAMTQLSASKGYRLVAVEPTGVNAFFLRNDVAPEISACDPARMYQIPDKYNEIIREKQLDVSKWARETGRERVDVG